MSATLVHELERLGVRLWEDAGQLRFRAPHGVMTDERRDLLRREKAAILQHLRDSAESVAATADPAARYDPFPLTDLQSAYVIGRRESIAYGGVACHAYGELVLADLDPERLERAWQRLIDRHDMLRAVIESDGSQRVAPDQPPYRIHVADLRGADAARLQETLDATRAELDHKTYPLGVWPMFDVRVTRSDEGGVLHLSIDFLIADYVSVQVVLDELNALYRDLDAALPPFEITFRDYLFAERRLRSGSRYDRDRTYWWARIDTLPSAPELPTLPPGSNTGVRFRRLATQLSDVQYAALQRRAPHHGVTASAALLAAYADVIARWSRHQRFTLNATVLQRLPVHADVERLVGDFTSVNLLAVDADPHVSFRERARQLQAQLWEDLDHRLCSGVEVMREMTRRRGVGTALMPIVYTSAIGIATRERPAASWDRNGELGYGISQTPQVWIDCQVMQRDDRLAINWDVREGVFPPEVVDDMFQAFADLVDALAGDDAVWASESPVTLPPAQQYRRDLVNGTSAPLSDELLHDAFMTQAATTPDRIAVIGSGRRLTYRELLLRARAVAYRLIRGGCRAGEAVGVWMEKGPDQVIGVLGALLAGAAYLPIDVDQPPVRRGRMLADAGVRHLLTTTSLAGHDPASSAELIEVDAIEPVVSDAVPLMRLAAPDDLAYVIYTSGSTGGPKGVMITHDAAVNTIQDINRRFDVGEGDRVLALANLGFDLSVYDIFGLLGVGGAVVFPRADQRANPAHWAQVAAEHGVTLWNSVPAQLTMLHDYLSAEPIPLPSLRLAMLSGDWIPTALPDQIRRQLPSLQVVSLGGATEGSIWSIAYEIDQVDPDWKSIPYGTPLTNQTFHVLDAALRDRPEHVAGELYIGGAGVALGYLGDPEKTAERFITHPVTGERLYRTGDLGRYLADGNIEFLGREDSQVKIRGHRIELAEVETALQAHEDIGRAAVVVYGDRPLERRLAGFVEPARRQDLTASPSATRVADAVAPYAGELDAGACNEVLRFARQLDQTALSAMMFALVEQGLFATPDACHSLDEILATAQVIPKHHRLVRRWLKALERHRLVDLDPASRLYRRRVEIDRDALDDAWRLLDEVQPSFERRTELIEYFRLTSGHLPELLRGEIDPMRLLFPEGRVEIHEAAYTDNFLSRYINRLVTLAVAEIADAQSGNDVPGPLRILEAGAGVGGTSVELIPSLANREATYLFTDVSPFFLNNARERYRDQAWVSYALFDINRDYRSQGLMPNSLDVIVCANVLHYARNAATVLGRFRELLRPGGWLVFIEMVRDNYQMLTSMEFLFDATVNDFEDVRKNRDETFITRDQWTNLVHEAGGEIGMCLPPPDHVLAEIGFFVFAVRFKHDRAPVHPLQIEQHLSQCLPEYMIPQHLQLVDALPTTDNGKIDRAMLRSWIPVAGAEPKVLEGEQPTSDLERRLAAVWSHVLRVEHVGRSQDFFELGGDSLLAAQLVGRMREEIPEAAPIFFDTLLRLVLDGPTIGKLAAHLDRPAGTQEQHQPAAAAHRSPLVHLPGLTEGPLRVLVHDASGTLASYAALVDDLARSGRVAGLVVNDANYLGTQAAATVRRAASVYTRALRDTPLEAVHLIGYNVGGILALEIARHLLEGGTSVPSLTVINSLPVPYLVDDELFSEYLFVYEAGVDPMKLGYPAESALAHAIDVILPDSSDRIPEGGLSSVRGDPDLDGVAWCFRRLAARSVEDRMTAIGRAVARSGGAEAPAGQVQALYDIFRHSLRAFALHPVAPYAGDVVLVRSTESTPLTRGRDQQVAAFWRHVCLGDLRIVDIPGQVHSALRPPTAAEVLDVITAGEAVGAPVR